MILQFVFDFRFRGSTLLLQKFFSVFEESESELPAGDLKIRITGVLTYMKKFEFFYALYIGYELLSLTDNLANALQTKGLTACEGQKMATNTISDLVALKSEEEFDKTWAKIIQQTFDIGIDDPVVPRVRVKNPKYFTNTVVEPEISPRVHYQKIRLEAIEKLIDFIKDRFDQPSYHIYVNLENLIVNAAQKKPYEENLKNVLKFYHSDFDPEKLKVQLASFSHNYQEEDKSLQGIIKYFEKLSPGMKTFYSEIYKIIQLILIIPASNASSERHFSVLKRIKNCLRSTMSQERLNHCMVTSIYKEELMQINLIEVLNKFVNASEYRKTVFGSFLPSDFVQEI